MATSVDYQRHSIQRPPSPSVVDLDYVLDALSEVESQRDAALNQVDRLTKQLKSKEAESAKRRPLATTTKSQSVIVRHIDPHALFDSSADTYTNASWCRGNWLTCGGELGPAEASYSAGNFRGTITMIDRLLDDPETEEQELRLNAILLKSKALSEMGLQYHALPEIFGAKRLAARINRDDLRAKTLFHEGVCYYRQKNYQSAMLSLAAATGAPHHEQQIQVWREKTESVMLGQGPA